MLRRGAPLLLTLGLLAGCAGGPGGTAWTAPEGGNRLKGLAGKALKPDDLVGLSATEIDQLFGEPSLNKREAPADILQYAGQLCVLLVFLYPDGGREPQPVVTYAEALTRSKSEAAVAPDCVGSLIKRPALVGL
jgi:hypothetical protein